ncbi:MAG TPA: hypothetical protein VJB91_00795 [Patescibacteria group bacterium]|nr:hypothetical protein [Patescibacteria group bacterium]
MIETREKDSATQELLRWMSPSRPYRRWSKDDIVTIATVTFLVLLLFVFLKWFLEAAVVIALFFVAYMLYTVPPEEVEHKVTPQGLTTAGHSYVWEELKAFWVAEQHGVNVLHLETRLRYPAEVAIVLKDISRDQVVEKLAPYLSYREAPEMTWLDKMSQSLGRLTFPERRK